MSSIRVLYDGWPLVYAPNSAAALHLLTLIEAGGDAVEAQVALPGDAPGWIPAQAVPQVRPTANNGRQRLTWQQNTLPGLAEELGCALLHSTTGQVPLNANVPVLVSPAATEGNAAGFWGRLGSALGAGGSSQALTLYPHDLADFAPEGAHLLPPVAHPAFYADHDGLPDAAGLNVYPGEFILAHMPAERRALRKVLDTWTWSARALQHSHPLVLAGLEAEGRAFVADYVATHELTESVQVLPALAPEELAAVYQQCSAVYHPVAPSPWGDAVRQGIAAGRPVVSYEQPAMAAMMGAAGFLVAEDDERKLGGQVIAISVKHNIAAEVARNALAKRAEWGLAAFGEALVGAYRAILD